MNTLFTSCIPCTYLSNTARSFYQPTYLGSYPPIDIYLATPGELPLPHFLVGTTVATPYLVPGSSRLAQWVMDSLMPGAGLHTYLSPLLICLFFISSPCCYYHYQYDLFVSFALAR